MTHPDNLKAPLSSNLRLWQLHELDHRILMMPIGTVPATPAVMCRAYGEQYVLASDAHAEIERLRAVLMRIRDREAKCKTESDDHKALYEIREIVGVALSGQPVETKDG